MTKKKKRETCGTSLSIKVSSIRRIDERQQRRQGFKFNPPRVTLPLDEHENWIQHNRSEYVEEDEPTHWEDGKDVTDLMRWRGKPESNHHCHNDKPPNVDDPISANRLTHLDTSTRIQGRLAQI